MGLLSWLFGRGNQALPDPKPIDLEKINPDVVGRRIVRLLQTPAEPVGAFVKEVGEAYYISLVAELDDGRLLHIGEFYCEEFAGDSNSLIPAELVQEEFKLGNIEGEEIRALVDPVGEFAVALGNDLFLICECGPGGNYPLIRNRKTICEE